MKLRHTATFSAALLALNFGFVQSPVHAAAPTNLLINGSFEDPNLVFVPNAQNYENLAPGNTKLTGWSIVGLTLSWMRSDNPFGLTPSDGSFSLDLTGASDNGNFATVRQTFATTPGALYHLSFDMGANNSCVGFDCTGPMAMRVNVAGVQQDFTGFDPVGPGMHWGTMTMDFTATATSTTLSLGALASSGGSTQFRGLDNVVVVAAVPEPQTYVLFTAALGVLGLQTWRRRRFEHGSRIPRA